MGLAHGNSSCFAAMHSLLPRFSLAEHEIINTIWRPFGFQNEVTKWLPPKKINFQMFEPFFHIIHSVSGEFYRCFFANIHIKASSVWE